MSHGSGGQRLIEILADLWCPPRWGRRSGLLLPPQRAPLHCRWCGKTCPPARKSWCSEACVKKYLSIGTWPELCKLIRERDQVCQNCGGGGLSYGLTVPERIDQHGHHHPEFTKLIARFEVDHIVTIHDGGTDDPCNLRLVCQPCHKIITSIWTRRRARLLNRSRS